VTARDRVGELRPSQLLHTFGIGATVELPELTALVLGLDEWPEDHGKKISEPRLLAAVRAAAGDQVRDLITPPVAGDDEPIGVPVAPFPRWLRCPLCSRLASIETGVFALKQDPWRPERTTYVHDGCPVARGRPPGVFPARYLIACANGHLDDFPWSRFLHGDVPCRGTLKLRELGSGGRNTDVELRCDECRRSRRLLYAFGDDAVGYLPPRCRGRHPHLGTESDCNEAPTTLVLGASNTWFPVRTSALSIPAQGGELEQTIDEAWALLDRVTSLDRLDLALDLVDDLRDLRRLAKKIGQEAVWEAISARRDGLVTGNPEDLRTPEWHVLCTGDAATATRDFRLRAVGAPADFTDRIADVVLVERLREVSALRGFTRLNAPDDLTSRGGSVAPLSRAAPEWLPCSEVRGEGIFLRFDEDAVAAWEDTYDPGVLRAALRSWRQRRNLDPAGGWLGERYVLLHSFAHALIRELSLECGYNASSIRERLYANDEMAGVLLYTAAPDSEGTLGGLVALGEPDEFGPLMRNALERAQLCSSDPLCSEHDPRADGSVHAAACHACQFASETSCEQGNRLLDRGALVATFGSSAPGYFDAP
jgi:hypothetical protein